MDEESNECHLLLQERCKDISFVASLQCELVCFCWWWLVHWLVIGLFDGWLIGLFGCGDSSGEVFLC